VRIYESAPPFDHSKAMTVDGKFSLIGSTNLDPRSLRLNFEFNLGCFDDKLAATLNAEFDTRAQAGREVTLEWVESRPLSERLKSGVARMFSPLL
jgi:cardiolipin synthase